MLSICNCSLVISALVCVFLTGFADAGNILGLFPHHGFSHFKVFYPFLRGLAERGHNVTVVTYIKSTEPHPNYNELLLKGMDTVNVFTLNDFEATRSLSVLFDEFNALHYEGQQSCEIFYRSGYVEKIFEQHKRAPYDLVITEFFNTDCYLGVPYMLQIPVVGFSSCALMPWHYDRILLPDTPSYVQSEFIGFPEELNWQQRLKNFVQSKVLKYLYRYYTNYYDKRIIAKYLNISVNVDDIAKSQTSLVFVNQHYTLSGNRPLTPQLIEVGGIHVDERQIEAELPQEIEQFLSGVGNENVLFISWGSMLRSSTIPKSKVREIIKVLQNLSLKIIWKWEAEEKPTKSNQFLFTKWAPQLTLLCHPKVKYFWGHGGLLGTMESVYCGKPLLITPVYGDQYLNAYAVQNRKVGRFIYFDDINEQQLKTALVDVMKLRYTQNARKLSEVFRNRLSTPLNTSIWWIEHLLQHGDAAHKLLHTKAVNMNWFVYHSLDSLTLILCGVALFLALAKLVLSVISALCKRRIKIKTS